MATEVGSITGSLNLDKTREVGDAWVKVGKSNQFVDRIMVQTAGQCAVRIRTAEKKKSIGERMIDRLSGHKEPLLYSMYLTSNQGATVLGDSHPNLLPVSIRCPIIISAMGEGTLEYSISLINGKRRGTRLNQRMEVKDENTGN